jgi:hypothetical protein
VFIGSNTTNKPGITLAVNPVESYLSFTYAASTNSMTTINVYSTSGAKVLSQRMNLIQGNNTITIAADGRLYTGAYILEVTNDKEISRAKFIKR